MVSLSSRRSSLVPTKMMGVLGQWCRTSGYHCKKNQRRLCVGRCPRRLSHVTPERLTDLHDPSNSQSKSRGGRDEPIKAVLEKSIHPQNTFNEASRYFHTMQKFTRLRAAFFPHTRKTLTCTSPTHRAPSLLRGLQRRAAEL